MNQTAITMTSDNSRSRKQANHRGPICILICICMLRGEGAETRESGEGGEGHGRRGWGLRVKGLSSLPGCMLLSLALSSPIKPATPQQ